MERAFDLRKQLDREELATFLPNIDGRRIDIPASSFIDGLKDVSAFLGNPDWLIYQWGTVGPLRHGKTQHPLELRRLVELGLELRDLSRHDNFKTLLTGFANPPQFFDTMFEVRTASFFSRLETTEHMRFAPKFKVRGRDKHPEFEFHNRLGMFAVECKRPHLFVQRAAGTFHAIAVALNEALKAVSWPPDLRLELEVTAPLHELPASFAKRILDRALATGRHGCAEFEDKAARIFVVVRHLPFCINDVKFWQDVMIVDSEGTGLLNPKKTILRVVNNRLDRTFATSTGRRLKEALKQLPASHHGIIVLGDIPRRIAEEAITRRVDDKAYDRVFAFVVHDDVGFHLIYRKQRGEMVQKLLSPGIRPLVPAV